MKGPTNGATDAANDEYRYVSNILSDEEIAQTAREYGYDFETEREDAIRVVANVMIEEHITTRAETGWNRIDAFGMIIKQIPESMLTDSIQSERDNLANDGSFEDFEDALRLEQYASEVGEDTTDARREIWDELLKFSEYEVEIRFSFEDEDEIRSDIHTLRRQASAEAHNDALRHHRGIHSEASFEGITTRVVARCFPDVDPLADLEEFVYHY